MSRIGRIAITNKSELRPVYRESNGLRGLLDDEPADGYTDGGRKRDDRLPVEAHESGGPKLRPHTTAVWASFHVGPDSRSSTP